MVEIIIVDDYQEREQLRRDAKRKGALHRRNNAARAKAATEAALNAAMSAPSKSNREPMGEDEALLHDTFRIDSHLSSGLYPLARDKKRA